ncbi:hypothetical protein VOLCADRAFT_97460 [Volvox carteri f. nagariensis]|uniref:Uncharacterized protein n=1 Tax=Volvox carteri f. nagariensis TaxID=3068 RepID=D8UCT5_VOLCA|nr:uncharacterized protein VOLCADRAFT_97460 [Volvox carteri f. nagariensis]EFJ42445.1 hypothetical protein VOLCADRAFT_97460 [Volvox carteri f. nagariensis]|eukprot:XP_002956508.1 hypothetical protein VOLCADRAFT_97460 [Volvox carteri f. nagariensis]
MGLSRRLVRPLRGIVRAEAVVGAGVGVRNPARRPARMTVSTSALALCAAVLTAIGTAAWLVLLGVASPPAANGFVPWDLTNFQNEYACDNTTVRIVRWRRMVLEQGFFCASNGSAPFTPDGYRWVNSSASNGHNGSSNSGYGVLSNWRSSPAPNGPANIVMQTMRPLRIEVNETEESVTVDAERCNEPTHMDTCECVPESSSEGGCNLTEWSTKFEIMINPKGIRTIDLLRYLAAYVTPSAPAGWTLPAFPWFVFQTLGGAVSTNTHGSSLKHSSLSSQVLALTMVLALKAVRVGVGKLGIITHIKFRIMREVPVTRTIRRLTSTEFLELLRSAQDQWNTNGSLPEWMDETEWFWVPQRHEFLMVTFTRGDSSDAAKRLEALRGYALAGPENTTAYNTSLALLEQAKDLRNVTVDVFPLLANVTFDPVTNIADIALPVLRQLNDTVLNVPWQQAPAAGAGAGAVPTGSDAGRSAAAADKSSPAVAAMAGPTTPAPRPSAPRVSRPSASLDALIAAVAASRLPKPADNVSTPANATTDTNASMAVNATAPAATPTPTEEPEVVAAGTVTAVPLPPTSPSTSSGPGIIDGAAPAAKDPSKVSSPDTNSQNGMVSLFRARSDPTASKATSRQRSTINGSGASTASLNEAGEGEVWSIPQRRPATVFYGLANMADAYIDISRSGVYSVAANATKESQSSYLFQPESILEINIRRVTYDQLEVAMPVSSMADCWKGLLELLYGADNLDGTEYNGTASPLSIISKSGNNTNGTSLIGPDGRPDYGFRSNPLVRTTGNEDGLLSPSGGQPHMWLNIEDYLYYNRPMRRTNVVFKALVGYLRSDPRCGKAGLSGAGARLHWGKSGKFRDSAPDRWNWNGVNLERCCMPDRGFLRPEEDPKCVCKVTQPPSSHRSLIGAVHGAPCVCLSFGLAVLAEMELIRRIPGALDGLNAESGFLHSAERAVVYDPLKEGIRPDTNTRVGCAEFRSPFMTSVNSEAFF